MATLKTLRPLLHRPIGHQRRAFLPNPFQSFSNPLSAPSYQTLTASRTLPYAAHPIYTIVADIPSYSSFLPYCQSSSITRWSAPDSIHNRPWPSEAEITVGYGNLTESFTSRIFCVPGRIVESVGGGTETELLTSDIRHHLADGGTRGNDVQNRGSGLLTHLRSRWTIQPTWKENGQKEETEVTLSLEYAFSNPLYEALSAGAASKVAEMMIRAFEERVTSLLEKDAEKAKAMLGDVEKVGKVGMERR